MARYNQHAEENPIAWGAGNVAGGILGAIPASGLAAAKGLGAAANASRGARIARAAGTGAGLGFLTNPGDQEGELADGLQMKDRLINAGIGGTTGLATQASMEGLSKLAKGGGNFLKDFAEKKAVKATGALKKGLSEVDQRGMTNRLGRRLLDEKVVTPLATPEKISQRLQPLIGDAMDQVDDLIEQSTAGGGKIDAQGLANKVKANIKAKFAGVPEAKIAPMLDEIDTWFPKREMTIREAQQAKQGMNQFLTDRNFLQQNPSGKTQAMLGVRKGLKEGVEENVDEIASQIGSKAGALKDANQRAGDFITAKDLADDGTIRQASNRIFGLSEQLGALGGMGAGEGIIDKGLKGAGLAAASRGVKTYGNSLAATGADKLSEVFTDPKILNAIKDRPELVQTLLNRGMGGMMTDNKKADPSYANSNLFKMIEKRPELVSNIQDPKLKEQMENYLSSKPSFVKQKIDDQESRNQFVEGN